MRTACTRLKPGYEASVYSVYRPGQGLGTRLVCTVGTRPIGLRMCVQCVPGLGLGMRLVCTVCTRPRSGYEASVYSAYQT